MLRLDKKTAKIAYRILGKPAPLRKDSEIKRNSRIEERLTYEETSRVR